MLAIEVEPMNPRGYTGAAEAYVGLGDYNRAREVLEDGLSVVGEDAGISGMLDDIDRVEEERWQAEIEAEVERRLAEEVARLQAELEAEEARRMAEIVAEINHELEGLLAIYEADGFDYLYEMMEPEVFENILVNIVEFPFLLLNEYGDWGIGIFEGGFIYIGGFLNGQRSGHGSWTQIGGAWWFEGVWADDMPNGVGNMFWTEGTYSGTLFNGLWNGTVRLETINVGPNTLYPNFVYGQVITIGEPQTIDGVLSWRVYEGGPIIYFPYTLVYTLWGVPPFSETV